jgi:hypothetical protein
MFFSTAPRFIRGAFYFFKGFSLHLHDILLQTVFPVQDAIPERFGANLGGSYASEISSVEVNLPQSSFGGSRTWRFYELFRRLQRFSRYGSR